MPRGLPKGLPKGLPLVMSWIWPEEHEIYFYLWFWAKRGLLDIMPKLADCQEDMLTNNHTKIMKTILTYMMTKGFFQTIPQISDLTSSQKLVAENAYFPFHESIEL